MPITKAIIPVSGWGTRRFPITKAIEKCMLPVGNRPIIDYVVQDCISAGIKDIYIVLNKGTTQIQTFYSHNVAMEEAMTRMGKADKLPEIAPPEGVEFHFIEHEIIDKYGTAVPLELIAPELPDDESFLVVMGDDFIYNADGSSEVARLLEGAGENSAMLGVTIDKQAVGQYGVLEMNDQNELIRIVEKPSVEEAPSNLINVSKYVITPDLFKEIVAYAKTDLEGEYRITDPITAWVQRGGKMKVVPAKGEFLDGGSVESWLHANKVVLGL